MMLMFDRISRKSRNHLVSQLRRPIKGRASARDAAVTEARLTPGSHITESLMLSVNARQAISKAPKQARNPHCKPQCLGLADGSARQLVTHRNHFAFGKSAP
jgi:hypothetical protein